MNHAILLLKVFATYGKDGSLNTSKELSASCRFGQSKHLQARAWAKLGKMRASG
jgi:ribosomal protein L37E